MGRVATITAVAAACFCGLLHAQTPPPLDPATPPAIVSTSPSVDDRVTIPIVIGGKGPWNFIVDTGSQRTVISSDLARHLALPAGQPVTIVSMAGTAEAQTVALPRLTFGRDRVDDIEAPVLDGEYLGAPGLLGLDGLHAKRLLLNFRTGKMEISAGVHPVSSDPDTIIVEARRRKGQLILLDSKVNGMTVNIILDTGTNLSVGNLALMHKLIKRKRMPKLQEASLTSVTGGVLTGPTGLIDAVKLGPVTLTNVPVLFADATPFEQLGLVDRPALLLGIDALRIFDRVAIDFGRGRVDFLLPDTGALDKIRLAAAAPVRG